MKISPNTSCSPREEAQIATPALGEKQFAMADVGEKPISKRRAIACGQIVMGIEAFNALKNGSLPKGNALQAAEIAGMTSAKQTANLLPLCHPLPLDKVALGFRFDDATQTVTVRCEVCVAARTGVEMEALMGVNGALLCLYDLIKPVDPALRLENIRLEMKEGGKKGLWIHPEAAPEWQNLKHKNQLAALACAVIVLSDRASTGEYADATGPALKDLLTQRGANITELLVLPDDMQQLKAALQRLAKDGKTDVILTAGGTGPARRDITPEVVVTCCDKVLPGIGEALRQQGQQFTKTTWLSRSMGGVIGSCAIVTLPGNPKAIAESMPVLEDLLPTIVRILKQDKAA